MPLPWSAHAYVSEDTAYEATFNASPERQKPCQTHVADVHLNMNTLVSINTRDIKKSTNTRADNIFAKTYEIVVK